MQFVQSSFVALAAVTLASQANAAFFSFVNSDTEFASQFGGIEELFVAEVRNVTSNTQRLNADWELGFGPDTQNPSQFEQRNLPAWSTGEYNFTLTNSADIDTMSFRFTGNGSDETITQLISTADLDQIFIRVAGLDANNTARVTGVSITTSEGAFGFASTPAIFSGATYIGIDSDVLDGDFTLTGSAFFTFNANTVGSRPSIQIKGLVPTPGAASLAAIAGLAAIRRRRSV
ncbi:MAG: choice-of-anchor W domain-containing protein [Planctomycetota bacterium]